MKANDENRLKILDCSLRDGAHINGGNFGEKTIRALIKALTNARIDIIEIGFLKDCNYNPDFTDFSCVSQAFDLLPDASGKTEYALMVRSDWYNIKSLQQFSGKVKHLRFAFYKSDIETAFDQAQYAREMGYTVHLNPVNTPGYSQVDLENILEKAQVLEPDFFYIVDTFGCLGLSSLQKIANLYKQFFNSKTSVGVHLHENLSMSFALAQDFIFKTDVPGGKIVDASLLGIGRNPGNLPLELIVQHLNAFYNRKYDLYYILNAIEQEIMPIKRNHAWGYSPEYFLSAINEVHRSYAESLVEKSKLSLVEMDDIFKTIKINDMGDTFDPEYLATLVSKKF